MDVTTTRKREKVNIMKEEKDTILRHLIIELKVKERIYGKHSREYQEVLKKYEKLQS